MRPSQSEPTPPQAMVRAAPRLDQLDLDTVGLLVIGPDGAIISANTWLRDRWAAAGPELGAHFERCLPDPKPRRLIAAVRACLSHHAPARLSHYLNRQLFPLRHPLAQDAQLFQHVTIHPITLSDGASACAVEIRDVSLEVEREAKLRRKIEELARANADLEIFSNAATHDLRAPVGAIQRAAELAEAQLAASPDCDAPEVAGSLAWISRAAAGMRKMVDDLLVYSRLGVDASPAETVSIAAALSEVRETARDADAEIVLETPDAVLHAARAEVALILRNLIGNAIKHSGGGRPRIVITGGSGPEGSWVTIADDGPGVPPDRLDDVLKPFETAGPTPGSGLGLAMIARIADARGGRASVASPIADGRGTAVTVSLPAG